MSEIEHKKLVLFYEPWCKFSTQFMNSVWKYFINNYKDPNVLILEEANCERQSKLNEYKIRSLNCYPTLILFIDNQAFIYNGKKCISEIEEFLNSPETFEYCSRLIYLEQENIFELENYVNEIDYSSNYTAFDYSIYLN